MAEKPRLSMYWAAACGGCEIALTNLHEKLLDVDAAFDFFFCPCLLDTKKKDVEALPDGGIFLTLFNGAIRTEENEEMAHLLRKKSKILIAFGSCSYEGCIPGLSNFTPDREAHFKAVYLNSAATRNPEGKVPQEETVVPEGTLPLPKFFDRVRTLDQVVPVDYYIPGCPPEPHQIWNVIKTVIDGKPLPPKGSILGAGRSTVCDECPRLRSDKKVSEFRRVWEFIPDPQICLLEQGVICMGVATRDGCGGLCPRVNMPCIGCYGPPEGVIDQGAKMVGALGSMLDIEPLKNLPEAEIDAHVDACLAKIPDLAGTIYKFSLPGSLLQRRVTATTEVKR